MFCRSPSKQSHSAREQRSERARIYYSFHPQVGHEVEVLGRSRLDSGDFLIIQQPDGTRAHVPQWMTQPEAGHMPMHSPPRLSLSSLRELRLVLDAVLSSSNAVQPQGGADEATSTAGTVARSSQSLRKRGGATDAVEVAATPQRTHRLAGPTPLASRKPDAKRTTSGEQ